MIHFRSRYWLAAAFVMAVFATSLERASATIVRYNTVLGTYDIRLFDALMPNSVANFLSYVNTSRYDGTFVHRSVPGFVIQGGGFTFDETINSSPVGIPLDPAINDEPGGGVPGPSNVRGTIAMAKSGPNTVTSQWFINLDNNAGLDDPNRPDGGFSAFGRVLGNGMDVVDAIAALPTFNLGGPFNTLPAINFSGGVIKQENLVVTNSAVELNLPDGDYNFDGTVDAADLAVWQSDFGSTTQAEADGNGDGIVDGVDFLLWQQNFGTTASTLPAAQGIPEPSTFVLLSLAALAAAAKKMSGTFLRNFN